MYKEKRDLVIAREDIKIDLKKYIFVFKFDVPRTQGPNRVFVKLYSKFVSITITVMLLLLASSYIY